MDCHTNLYLYTDLRLIWEIVNPLSSIHGLINLSKLIALITPIPNVYLTFWLSSPQTSPMHLRPSNPSSAQSPPHHLTTTSTPLCHPPIKAPLTRTLFIHHHHHHQAHTWSLSCLHQPYMELPLLPTLVGSRHLKR